MSARTIPSCSNLPRLLSAFAGMLAVGFGMAHGEPPPVRVVATPNDGEVPDAYCPDGRTIDLAYVRGDDLFHVRSTDGGQSFSPEQRVNSTPGTVHPANAFRGPDLAVDQTGTVHVAWYVNAYQRQRPHDEWGVHYARRTPDAHAFETSRNLNHRPSDGYSLAVSHDGGTVAVFWLAEQLFLTRSTNGGDTFADAEPITGADPCECCGTRTVVTRDGSALCLFRDKKENHRDMHLAALPAVPAQHPQPPAIVRLDDDPWVIDACPMTGCHLEIEDTQLRLGWIQDGRTRWMQLAVDAIPRHQGTPETPHMPPPNRVDSTASNHPLVLADPQTGVTCVSWKQANSLRWQRFDSQNQRIGDAAETPSHNPHRHTGIVTKDGFILFN